MRLVLIIILFLQFSCKLEESGLVSNSDSDSSRDISSDPKIIEKNPYFKEYDDPVYISGSAFYQYVEVGSNTNYNASSGKKPIRKAFILVYDGNKIIQGVNSELDGSFKIPIPKSNSEVELFVLSRSKNSYMKEVSVVVDVGTSSDITEFYRLEKQFIPDEDKDIGSLTAQVDGSAGAFNILDHAIKGADWLKDHADRNFTQLDDLQIYWSLGQDEALDSNSYFIPELNVMRIRGGDLDANKKITGDPDHFDNSIILHEYGHFVESALSRTDSPGGIHNSFTHNFDPRLAWSEGFSHFFQKEVLNKEIYYDFFSDGVFSFNLERKTPSSALKKEGDGEFRELAIARYLTDLIDSDNDDSVDRFSLSKFLNILFSKDGFKKSNVAFVSVGLLNYFLDAFSIPGLSSLKEDYHLGNKREFFAQHLDASSSTCDYFTFDPDDSYQCSSAFDCPDDYDWIDSNAYFHYYASSGGSVDLKIEYTLKEDASNDTVSVRIFTTEDNDIWKAEETSTSVEFSPHLTEKTSFSLNGQSGKEDEASFSQHFNVRQSYLINLRTSLQSSSFKYKIFMDGDQLCPADY